MNDTSIPALLSHFGDTKDSVALINPVSGKRITEIPQMTEDQVFDAVNRARARWTSANFTTSCSTIKVNSWMSYN